MSDTNRVELRYIEEDGPYGDTPVAGVWQRLRYTSATLAANPQTQITDEIVAQRAPNDLIILSQQVGGEFGFEFSADTYDDFLEAVMMDTWSGAGTGNLDVGETERSFSFEMEFTDWTTPYILQFKGMRVNTVTLNFAYGAIVTGSVQMLGKTSTASETTLVGAGSVGNVTTTEVIRGGSDITAMTLGGVSYFVRDLALTISNTMRPVEAIGNDAPSDYNAGRSMVTGSGNIYFDDKTLYEAFIQNNAVAVVITAGDGVNTYTFNIPRAKFNTATPPVSGVDTDVMLPFTFTALYSSGDGYNLRITKA